jgi:tyrosine-protein kinase Etk/Wzc
MSERLPVVPHQSGPLPESGDGSRSVASWQDLRARRTPEEPGTDWRRHIAAALRYKWLILLTTLLGTAGGYGAARMVKPEYEAEATLWIETPDRESAGPIRSGQLLASYGWVELIRSFTVLDSAVRGLRLYLNVRNADQLTLFDSFHLKQAFVTGSFVLSIDEAGSSILLETTDGIELERTTVGDSVGASLGFAWVPPPDGLGPGEEIQFSVVTPRDAARALAVGLRTRIAQDGNFLRVSLVGKVPERAAAAVNAVMERFIAVAAELKRGKLTEFASILAEQLGQAERNLREAEIELESFRVRTITLPSEGASPLAAGVQQTQDPVFSNFIALRVEAEQLDRDLEAIRRALTQLPDSGLTVAALEIIPSVQRSTEVSQALSELTDKQARVRALRYSYTPEHPVVRELEGEVRELEQATIPGLVRGLIDEVSARQAELEGRIGSASQELQQIPPRAIHEARLRRDVVVAENLYTTLQQRYEQARLAEASSIPDVRILDPAVAPVRPLSNRGPRLVVMGFMAGLGLGVVGAVLLDRIDRRVRYPEQVTAELGLPLLGAVPHIRRQHDVSRGADDAVVEALRGVRLNLVHAYGAAGPILLTVTSPEAGDGKSFISTNLALAFAAAGHRSLLIDGDTRRGHLHRVLNVPRKPGLTELLSGSVPRNAVVRETAYRNLYFVGCGGRTREAPELVSSPAMSQLVTGIRSSFGAIVIDSPPLGAGVDAFALGTVTGNLLLVLRLGTTNRELAEAKLDVLDRLPIRVLGAVLNDVRGGDVYRYYSYGIPGYEHTEEGERKERKLLGPVG